jgi:hypothetical protein
MASRVACHFIQLLDMMEVYFFAKYQHVTKEDTPAG